MIRIFKVMELNSDGTLAVTIPKPMAKELGISKVDYVSVQLTTDGAMRVEKVKV